MRRRVCAMWAGSRSKSWSVKNQGVSNVELSGEDIKAFERVARKYGVDYAVKKVKAMRPGS